MTPDPIPAPDPGLAGRLLAFWRSVGAAVRPGVADAALADFERRHGVALPPAARDYLRAADGMEPDGRDDLFFRFLPLAEWQPAADQGGPASTFTVAENRLGGFSYVIRLGPGSSDFDDAVTLWDDDWVRPVAPSLAAFLEVYLAAPARLFPSDEQGG